MRVHCKLLDGRWELFWRPVARTHDFGTRAAASQTAQSLVFHGYARAAIVMDGEQMLEHWRPDPVGEDIVNLLITDPREH